MILLCLVGCSVGGALCEDAEAGRYWFMRRSSGAGVGVDKGCVAYEIKRNGLDKIPLDLS